MPAIFFPNLAAVGSALAGRAVSPAMGRSPARVGFASAGGVWLQPAAPLSRAAAAALSRVGAAVHAKSEVELTEAVGSWSELLPLAEAPVDPTEPPSPVLFDVTDATQLPALVAELRRLGAGRIGIRWSEPPSPPAETGGADP